MQPPGPSRSGSAAARTRAQPATPRPRGLRGGRAGGGDLLSPPPQRPERLERGPGPSPVPRQAVGAGRRGACAPEAAPDGQRPSFPRQPRVPQLVPVRPMNWCVRGFHTNSFHSSTTCPRLFFSFWMTISAARGESRRAAGGCGEAGASRAKALHAPAARGEPGGADSGQRCSKSRGTGPRAVVCWQSSGGAPRLGPPDCDRKGGCGKITRGRDAKAASPRTPPRSKTKKGCKIRRLQNPSEVQKKRGAKKRGKMGEGAAPKSKTQRGCGTRQVAG